MSLAKTRVTLIVDKTVALWFILATMMDPGRGSPKLSGRVSQDATCLVTVPEDVTQESPQRYVV